MVATSIAQAPWRWLFAALFLVLATLPKPGNADTRFEGVPERLAGNQWRLTWTTEPGKRYLLERSSNLTGWDPVTEIDATADTTSFTDTGVPTNEPKVFWRARLLDGPDTTSPVVSILNARLIAANGEPSLELTVQAKDNVGVVGVSYIEGVIQLGAASEGPVGTWKRIVPVDLDDPDPRQFQARANDVAGNTGFSDIYTYIPAIQSPDLLPLGPDGAVVGDSLVGQKPDGSLNPFTYLPDLNGGGSPGHAFRIDFPNGGEIIEIGDDSFLDGNLLRIGFGPDSPTQLLKSDGQPGFIELTPSNGIPLRIKRGTIAFADLATLMGVHPAVGIPLLVHGKSVLLWKGGILTRDGIRGGLFNLKSPAIGLPSTLGGFEKETVDLSSSEPISISVHGTIRLGPTATLEIAKASPLQLELLPNGEITLRGAAEAVFNNGARFHADVLLDDPVFSLSLRAGNVEVPLMASLSDLLPSDPESCIPGGFDQAALDHAAKCLAAHDRAYRLFIANARGLRPDAPGDSSITAVPTPGDLTGAAAEAWATLAASELAASVPLQPLQETIASLSEQARGGGSNPIETIEAVGILNKILATATALNQQDLTQQAQAAILAAKPAVLRSLENPNVFSSEALNTIIPILTNGEFDFDPELSAAVDKLLRRAIEREATRIGVLPGVTSPAANTLLQGTSPYAGFEILRRLAQINIAANLGGLDAHSLPLFQECYQQVFAHAYQTILAGIDRNLADRNPLAITLLFIELNRLLILEDASPFDIIGSPGAALVAAKLSAANDLLHQAIGLAPSGSSNTPATRDQVFTLARQFTAILEIADRLPDGDSTVDDIALLIFERLETLLPATTNPIALAAETDENNLFLTLQAGIAHSALKRRNPSFPSTFDWNGPPVGEVVARLAEIAITTGDTAFLGKTIQFLLDEATTLESAAQAGPASATALRQLRKRQLVVAAETLAAIHPIAIIEWDTAEARRAADPESTSTDGFLPGNLKIDKLHGSLRHNRLTGKTEGKFGGKLRLPKLDSSLTIHSGSIDSDGRFDIAASGALRLPGSPDAPVVSLTVPSSQPLHFAIEPARAPRISGRAKLTFDNGTSLAVGLRFDDPIYTFQAEVGSLDTGLRDAILAVNSPQLGSLDATLPWADYYEGFSNWFESSTDVSQSPDGPPATDDFPDFAENPGFDSTALLDAWLSRCLAEARSGSDTFLSSSSAAFAENFAAWNAGLERMLSAFDDFFPPNAEQRANDVLKRLGEIASIQKKMAGLLQALANANLTGSAEFDLAFVTAALDDAALIHSRAIQAITPDPDLIKRPELVRETATAGLDLAAARQLAGLDASAHLTQTLNFLRNGMEAFLASRGLNPNGSINGGILATLDSATIEETFRQFFSFHGDLLRGGDLAGPPESHIVALTRQLAQSALDEASFDLASGVIDDSASDESLISLARRLHSAYIEINQSLTTPINVPPSVSFTAFLLHKKLLERTKSLPADAWIQRAALLTAAGQARDIRISAGGTPLSDIDINAEEIRMLDAFASQGTGRLRPEEFDLLKALEPRRDQGRIAVIYDNRILESATHIFLATAPPWSLDRLPLAIELQREIRQLDLLAGPSFPFPAQRDPAFLLSRLVSRTAEVSAASNKGKPPATIAREALQAATPAPETVQIRALLGANNTAIKDILEPSAAPDPHSPAFQTALKTEAAALLDVSRSVIANRATTPRPAAAPDLILPGDLRIERAFGGFYYDRSSGFLRGTFGGKLLFPDPRASFEITEATFDNLGAFSISAATTTPVTVMDNDRATLAATLSIAGNPLGLASVAGSGTLTVPFGPDQPGIPGTRSYNGSFSYLPDEPGKPLAFTAAIDGVQNEFKLGNDFALFDANLALTFSTTSPDITLQLGGKAGFFARPDAPASLGPEGKFWVVCDIDELEIAVNETNLRASFNGGTLKLAQDLFESDLPGGDGFVKFDLEGTLGVDFPFATGIPSFFGNDDPAQPFRVNGSGFSFRVPGIEDSLITVNTCKLELFQNKFPVLAELAATFRFPLPGINSADPAERVPVFGLNIQRWAVDGFPPESVTITITNGVTLFDIDGFDISMVGQSGRPRGINPPTIAFLQVLQNGETFTRIEIQGGMRVGIDSGLIAPKSGTFPSSPQANTNVSVSQGAMRATLNGSFGWTFAPSARPTIAINEFTIQGNFILGGALEIVGVNTPLASLRIRGFQDLFTRNNPNDPFRIDLTASVGIPDIGTFQLSGARFVWRDPNSLIPSFDIDEAGLALGNSLSTFLGEGLPIYVKKLSIGFRESDRPLIGSPGTPGRFDIDNLILTLTAGAEFPPAPPIDIEDLENPENLPPSGPRFGGEITNLVISYPTGNLLFPEFALDSVRMGIQGLDIPPLNGLSGQVALLNLQQLRADPPRPDLVTFVGELGADFNGEGVSVLLAASPDRIHGAGITVQVPAGIPLDGGVLGGILWKGASGGLHFKNSFDDPLEFESYLNRDASGNFTSANEFPPPGDPALASPDIEDPLEEVELANDESSIYAKPEFPEEAPQQFDPFDVLQGNWPPRAANPLLEEFPSNSGRFVFKGSRMPSAEANTFLNQIGILPGDTRTAEQIITAFLTAIIDDVSAEANAAVNALIIASNQQDNPGIIAHYEAITQKLIDSFDDVARPILRGILQPVGLAGGPSVRQQMHDLLLGGIPGFNVTFLGSGTFTHTALAPVMDLKGTISASTTGAALSRGELRVAGIPVAEASLGISLTNQDGLISPFFGGLARVGIGPLQLGKVTMSAKFPDAAAIVTHFDAYLNCTTTALSAAAEARFRILTELALDAQVPPGTSLQDFLLARTDAEKVAVVSALFDYFAQAAEGTLSAEAILLQDDFNTLLNCFAEFVASTLNSLTPELGFGGKIEPSIFDIPLTTSGMPLASARMRYGSVLRQPDPAQEETFISIRGNPADFTDPTAAPGVREFSAYMQFSPSAMLLAPITGTFVALNPTNAAFAGFTAIDFAEFGFSFQQEEWTAEKVVIFLTNPALHFENTTNEFFNTAVFAAGYQMSPFGMNLADGQLRLVFPNSELHPRRPGGINAARLNTPVNPLNSNGQRILPTTDELILAAITSGRIKDATFRGEQGTLVDLFPVPPPEGSESLDSNIAKIQRLSRELRTNDPDLTALAGQSFAKDYFPYGGIIGGGQLALPRLLTQGLPESWGTLFTPNLPADQWLAAFGTFAEDLSATETIGQLAYYIPAPNPVIFPGENPTDVWTDISIEELLSRLQMDPASLIGRSINSELYDVNEIVLAGWAQANLLGIPLGEARMKYDGNNRRLEAIAQTQPGSWFSDFFSADATFAIQLPSDQEAGLVTYSTSQLFELIQQNITGSIPNPENPETSIPSINSLSGPELDTRIGEIQQSLIGSLPRISLEITGDAQLPPSLSNVLRSSAGLDLFAFSPYFEPDFEPANSSPYAVAKRRGGIGIGGDFDFGYFPSTGTPIVINAAGQLSLTPSANVSAIPAINGLVEVGEFSIPGAPSFTGGELAFSSSPDNNAPYISVAGNIEPFVFQLPGPLGPVDLLRAEPLAPATLLGGNFRVLRSDGAPGNLAVDLSLNAMSAAVPFLGPDAAVTLHGGANGTGGFDPFSFSTATGQSWSAQIAISAAGNPLAPPVFGIGDPFDPSGQALMTFTPSGPLTGSISGVGLDSFTASFTAPTGFEIVFYPGTGNETRVGTPAGEEIAFMFDSTGRVYCDLGSLTQLALPGGIAGGARIEFGYNPTDPIPDVRIAKNNNESILGVRGLSVGTVNLVNSLTQTFEVRNVGSRVANIGIEVLGSTEFTPSTDGFQLEPGGERTVSIVFQPRSAQLRSGTVRVTSDDPVTPTRSFIVIGSGLAEPIYVASRPNVNFGDTLVGATSTTTFTVGNSGSASMVISSATVEGSGFSVTPAGSITLGAGQSQNYTVSFTPGALGPANGSLNLNINAPIGPKSIPLAGNGSESRWVTLLDSELAGKSHHINALEMIDPSEGFAVGDAGTFLQTRDGGRSWIPRQITTRNLRAIGVARGAVTRTPIAFYHLDESPGSPVYTDASGNGRHGVEVATAEQRPVRSFANGRFGSGLNFDGVDDFAELAVIAMPSSFSVSMWARFQSNTGERVMLVKDDNAGGNQFRYGFSGNRYEVRLASTIVQWSALELLNTWRHLVLTVSYDAATNTSTLNLYRDGSSLGARTTTGAVTASTSTRWKLGTQRSGTTDIRHFHGDLDEVLIFDGVLDIVERDALRVQNLSRMAVVGDRGTVLQSFSRGRLWAQHPDLNASGWRNQTSSYQNLSWHGVSFSGPSSINPLGPGGPMYLAGSQITGFNSLSRAIMVEGINNGQFDLVGVSNTAFGVNPFMTGVSFAGQLMRATSSDGTVYTQNWTTSPAASFTGLSGLTGGGLNAVTGHNLVGDYVAVGNAGKIITSNTAQTSGTTASLRALAFSGNTPPNYHVVGDGGVYLTSGNFGTDWQVVQDGLKGDMRAVDVQPVPGGSASEYQVWAAGENHSIQYRSPAPVTGPFMTFFPGKLDFGFVLAGESRTLETTIVNRGKQPLVVTNLAVTGPAASRFTLAQSSLAQLPPDAALSLRVRYRPTAASGLDIAELVVTTNDPARPVYRIPLEGRAGTRDWLPVVLASEAQPLDGEVLAVKFTSDIRGYALVQPASGRSRLYWTNNGGETWSSSNILTTDVLKWVSMDAVRPQNGLTDVLLFAGHVENTEGTFVRGNVSRLNLSNITNPGTLVSVTDITPIPSGQSTQPLRVSDVSAKELFFGSTTTTLLVSAITTGSFSTSNVWTSTNTGSSWFVSADNLPNSNGGVVETFVSQVFNASLASFGSAIHFRVFGGNWGTQSQQVAAPAEIRDMQFLPFISFGANLSRGWAIGDGGAFLMWTGQSGQSWFPAGDAEVFGTTNLKGVHSRTLHDVWTVGESKIFDSADRGETWRLNFDAGDASNLLCVNSRDGQNAWVGGSVAGKATIWRYAPPPAAPAGLINVVDSRDWGNVTVGASSTQSINIANLSATALPLHNLRIETDEPRSRFRLSGTVPTTINGNSSTNLGVVFDAAPEQSFAEELGPHWYFRFENEWDSTVFTDDSANARGAELPATVAQRPALALSQFRDRALRFDGGDHLEVNQNPGPDSLPGSFAIALWAAPESVSGTRVMVAKETSTGADRVKFALTSTGYLVRVGGVEYVHTLAGAPPLEWQHLVANFERSLGSMRVKVYRNGALLFERVLGTTITDIPGKNWILGAEYTATTTIANRFLGALDDVMLVPRILAESEIAGLAAKSSLVGEHRARLVIDSGSENGTREVALRATVGAAPRFLTLNSEPQGLPVKVDGVDYVAPVSFAIVPFASTAAGAREWIEGSQHRIEVPDAATRNHPSGSVSYRFADWTSGPSRQFTITANRDVALTHTATFVASQIVAPPVAAPPPRPSNGPNPLLTALADAPKGPFLRITDGQLRLPNLAGNEFAITGELFLSLSRIQGQLASTAFALPESGTSKFLEIGASNWRIDATAGGLMFLEARPPSLSVLGYDVLPEGLTRLEFAPSVGATPAAWTASFQLARDFKPAPDMLEFKKGGVELRWLAATGPPAFTFALNGGIRVLRLPNSSFALDRNVAVRMNTADFDVGLKDLLTAAGQAQPANLFASGPFTIGWSDVRLQRVGGGAVSLSLAEAPFSFQNNLITTIGGSLNTEGILRINGTLGEGDVVRIDPSDRFRLEALGSSAFTLEISPRRLALATPSMRLKSTDPALSDGVVIPGVRFDSTGAFDTGKIALPALNFDGIAVSGPSDGRRDDNHIRFQRDTTSRTTFTLRSEQTFLICRQNLALTMTSVSNGLPTVTGSMSGNFCLLPEPISLRYNSGSTCQFSGSAFGFTLFFGSSCSSVRNDATGICVLGTCP